MTPLEVLYERQGLPAFALPAALARLYGSSLGFSTPRVFANFVSSVDGVVALPIAAESGAVISGKSEADRFVMGLLRACADVVLVGAGTFRKTPRALWTPEAIHPPSASAFAELRNALGLPPQPLFVVVSASGQVDSTAPALSGFARVVSSARGEPLPLRPVIDELKAEGRRFILSEGGPSLFGQLVAEGVVDELFLTSSPLLLGRTEGDGRKSLVHAALSGVPLDLMSARRHGSYLFFRYELLR
jgi:riboflavin biosynthesis pyrimidine reductase